MALLEGERFEMRQILAVSLALLLSAWSAGAQDYDDIKDAYWRGDYEAVLKELLPYAEGGDAMAQAMLAQLYADGKGVPQDYAEAARWYRLAANQGHAEAQNNLGLMYNNGEGAPRDNAEAVKWYRLAADQGAASAQNNLGRMYYHGEGVPQDYAEAARWYRLAADQGEDTAQFNLGYMYYKGEGVTQDKGEALRWYLRSADQGNVDAQINLGVMYSVGDGVLQDNVQAHMRGNIGCALGQENGCKVRDLVSAKMTPADISEAQRRARVCMESDYKDCD